MKKEKMGILNPIVPLRRHFLVFENIFQDFIYENALKLRKSICKRKTTAKSYVRNANKQTNKKLSPSLFKLDKCLFQLYEYLVCGAMPMLFYAVKYSVHQVNTYKPSGVICCAFILIPQSGV